MSTTQPRVLNLTVLPPSTPSSAVALTDYRFKWVHSIWFDLLLAAVVGFVYTSMVLGPKALNVHNTAWLTPDPATYFIGWEEFRQDPHWHWPLMHTERLGYPEGESVALMDLNPLFALPFKLVSFLLPHPFNYLGLEAMFACSLQFFFASRLFRLFPGATPISVGLFSSFFVLSPPLNYRLVGHYTLSNHWVILAAIVVFVRTQKATGSIRHFAISTLILAAVAIAMNPYFAFPVLLLLSATVVSLVWQRRLAVRHAWLIFLAMGITSLAVAYAVGFIIPGGRGYGSPGYRYYSMNLLSPFNPYAPSIGPPNGSIILPKLPVATAGQYEGYNYFGAGVLALLALVFVMGLLKPGKLPHLKKAWALPLLACALVLTLMAFSTKITIGSSTLFDLDSHERLSPYLSPLRSSGRLFWAPYYLILTALLSAPFLFFRKSRATLLLVIFLIVQFADTAPLRHWIHSTVQQHAATPLRAPIWHKLGSVYQNLIVVPAWQCSAGQSPAGQSGYQLFGFLAVEQRMRINSYYSGRYTEASRDHQCAESVPAVAKGRLSPDTAYVVTPVVASLITEGPTGPGRCHDVDTFVLCSVRDDLGLSQYPVNKTVPVPGTILDAGFEADNISPWISFGHATQSVTTSRSRTGTRSFAQTDGAGSIYQDVRGLQPGATYDVAAWVSGSPDATARAQIATLAFGSNAPAFTQGLEVRAGWQLLSQRVTINSQGTLRIHLCRLNGTGTIYWDDIQLYQER